MSHNRQVIGIYLNNMNAKKELFLSKEALMLKHDFDDRAYKDQRGVQDLQSIGEEALMGTKL